MNPAETYILKQPEPYRSILVQLQLLIEHTLPDVDLKYKYKIPFYYVKGKPFCYFNASHKKQFVDIGFCRGNQIQMHKEHHVTEKRKKMFSLRYKTIDDINDTILIDILKEAESLY